MLRLKLPTDKFWASLVENNLKEALIDHCFCEQKAASTAISLIVTYPEYSDLVEAMSEVAMEEMQHFQQVHKRILQNGWELDKERKDIYVNELRKFFTKTRDRKVNLVNRLLLAAMIEARSCERFRVLATTVKDKELAEFYNELTKSEAGHYVLFLNFARKYGEGIFDVEKTWQKFLIFESEVIKNYGNSALIHG
jgi:tRNA-(ms[2]io[6]A)-hydroxylase